jgi:hypothetical protein
MTEEEIECLQKHGYLSFADERAILHVNGSPVSTFDPISPMICQSNQIAYNMADLANANFSALHTEQASRMDDICTQFATPYNETKSVGISHVPSKPKDNLEALLSADDLEKLWGVMRWCFAWGVLIPFFFAWLLCDHFLLFF